MVCIKHIMVHIKQYVRLALAWLPRKEIGYICLGGKCTNQVASGALIMTGSGRQQTYLFNRMLTPLLLLFNFNYAIFASMVFANYAIFASTVFANYAIFASMVFANTAIFGI